MTHTHLQEFLVRLRTAASFEAASGVLLDAMRERWTTAGFGELLRGMVHLRPDDAYTGWFTREWTSGHADPAPSGTAWQWVSRERAPILMDVCARVVYAARGEALPSTSWPGDIGGFRSQQHVLERQTTHIAAMPMLGATQRVHGFVSLELNLAPDAPLTWWSRSTEVLDVWVSVATPFMLDLPRTPASHPSVEPDQHLPVIGATMQPIMGVLTRFARSEGSILLRGETGVGKSRMARWCHQHSDRAARRFVRVNLVDSPENLRESTLFGHRKGAFTDAREGRDGMVAKADGGTLFIDEIDKLPLDGQAMLLSLLDDGEYLVVGDSESRHADVRFIVGTNADLEAMVADGRFRADLYHRICVLPVRLPPLRERRDEIVPWARYFAEVRYQKGHPDKHVIFEAGAAALLERQPWPGNLRELDNVIQRVHALMTDDDGADEVRIRESDVERALALGMEPASEGLAARVWQAMENAAHQFLLAAQAAPDGLHQDRAKVLPHLILYRAVEQLGIEVAHKVLGRAKYLESGNRKRLVNQASQAIDKTRRVLGLPPLDKS